MALITRSFDFDAGRQVTVSAPSHPPEAIIFAGDGEMVARWGEDLATAGGVPTMIVGVHRAVDETRRLHEYSPAFEPHVFAAHESFLVEDVRDWVSSHFRLDLEPHRTAVFGVSAGGELALALGVRHPDAFGTVLCASPGAGYRPQADDAGRIRRAYFVAGRQEPFFQQNAIRWVDALCATGAEVVMAERDGEHGGAFWRAELPLMAAWAFPP